MSKTQSLKRAAANLARSGLALWLLTNVAAAVATEGPGIAAPLVRAKVSLRGPELLHRQNVQSQYRHLVALAGNFHRLPGKLRREH